MHNPVSVDNTNPGRQNGEHPLVTPVSPGGHPGLVVTGTATSAAATGAATNAAANRPAMINRRNGCVMGLLSVPSRRSSATQLSRRGRALNRI